MNTQCGLPGSEDQRVVLGHGGGGRLSYELIHEVIGGELKDILNLHDQDAGFFELECQSQPFNFLLDKSKENLVMTTDSFVIDPLFFPGGDIGSLSAVGTVNDIAVMGAQPVAFSLSFIIEEGFLISDFKRILKSIYAVLKPLGISVTCGDTKVVPRGKVDQIYINTSAVGVRMGPTIWSPKKIECGDRIILSRDIGNHGVAVLGARHQLGISTTIQSDCHELLNLSKALISKGVMVHCARDLTRGGLLAAVVELAQTSKKGLEIEEELIPCSDEVRSFCEILGLDILSMANEGAALYFVPEEEASKALKVMHEFSESLQAKIIGRVNSQEESGYCLLKLISGVKRRCVLPPGELLPRIC